MTINVGDKAPAFTLKSTDFEDVSLTDFSNKNVLILFFPMAFTGVCTAELCQMRDDVAKYNDLNAEVLAISVDSPFTLAKFKADNQLNFSVLSDFNKEVSVAYDAFYEEFALGLKGVSKRAAFIVGKDGNVKYAEVLESPKNLPNFEAIKQTLSDLQ
ncbi:MAG: redoxin domain-containing protein [Saprospiraceae bacterium]|nr:redoxin domain-containing protein [Saprospiraceae bacterium]